MFLNCTFRYKNFNTRVNTVGVLGTTGTLGYTKSLNAQFTELDCLYTNFVKLHDKAAFDYELVLQLRAISTDSCKDLSIVNRRANVQAANRFARAGLTLRMHKLYAQAFKYILANLVTNFNYVNVFYQQTAYNFTAGDCLSVIRTCSNNFILAELFKLNVVPDFSGLFSQELLESRTDLTNMSFFYRRLSALAPVSAFHVKRVDKLRYKHSRGRSGRFENKWVRLRPRQRFSFSLTYLKYNFSFSEERCLKLRVLDVMSLFFISPENTWCHMAGSKAFLDKRHRYAKK